MIHLMIPIHGRMRQHDLETVIKCVFSVFNTPNATSATMVDSSKKPVTMTVTVSQSQSSQQRQPKIKNRHFPRIFGTIKAQSDKQRMVGPKQDVAGSNPVSPTGALGNIRFSRAYFFRRKQSAYKCIQTPRYLHTRFTRVRARGGLRSRRPRRPIVPARAPCRCSM